MPPVEAFAPCRADLAGGTLDIWPLGILHPGSLTVNAALPLGVRLIVEPGGAPEGAVLHSVGGGKERLLGPAEAATDLTAAVVFHLRPAAGVAVRVLEQAPVGSGLGGSSAYGMALASALLALEGRTVEAARLVAVVRDLEARVLGAPAGCQDHWAAVKGGVLAVHLEPGGERVERLAVDPAWLAERLTVFYTGITHHSGMVNWEVIRRRLEGDPATTAALEAIAAAARDCRAALLAEDEAGVGAAIVAEWTARRTLAPEVSPPELERVVEAGLGAGALAVKACGAGGGGSVLLWHGPGLRETLATALAVAAPGGGVLASGVSERGVVVTPLG